KQRREGGRQYDQVRRRPPSGKLRSSLAAEVSAAAVTGVGESCSTTHERLSHRIQLQEGTRKGCLVVNQLRIILANIKYAYPPPDGNILTNILNALIVVPRFYTQVLHLMNKMNIPAPFRMALPTPPLPPVVPSLPPRTIPPPPPAFEKTDLASSWSDESEMESSEEEIDKDIAHEAVGLKPAALLPKEIPIIKKNNTVLQIKIAPKRIQSDEIVASTSRVPENPVEDLDVRPYPTAEEIERQKLPPEEILSLPMFKNYTAENPANVLYIKNLAKDVVVDDIYYIFGSLFGSIHEAKCGLSVKLMQVEGVPALIHQTEISWNPGVDPALLFKKGQ
ncbi:hypothetical protein Dimus_037561, partial [Dionaea muscipula]